MQRGYDTTAEMSRRRVEEAGDISMVSPMLTDNVAENDVTALAADALDAALAERGVLLPIDALTEVVERMLAATGLAKTPKPNPAPESVEVTETEPPLEEVFDSEPLLGVVQPPPEAEDAPQEVEELALPEEPPAAEGTEAPSMPAEGTRKHQVLTLLLDHADGYTDAELIAALPEVPKASVIATRVGLVRDGLVVDSEESRVGPTGRSGAVWRVTPVAHT